MDLQYNIWYKAVDQYDGEFYINYIMRSHIKHMVKYFSIEVENEKIGQMTFTESTEEDFEEDIENNYNFEEIDITLYQHLIIDACFEKFVGDV